jgi:DNA polymerase IIIc chi subunit
MKSEISFYQVDEDLGKSIAPLMLKILGEKKHALIFTRDEKLIKDVDYNLWAYGKSKFIPHITVFDEGFEAKRQPIFITNKEENANNADYLIFLDEPSEGFAAGFKRVFYFFAEGGKNTTLKPDKSYKKEGGKWVSAG